MDRNGELVTVRNGILVLISAAIIFAATVAIAQVGKDSVDRELCRDEILLRSSLKIGGQTLFSNLDNCKTDFVEVERKEIGDKNSIDKYKVHKLMADEMYDCWYQFERGEKDFLPDVDAWAGDNWCFVCSRLDFDKDSSDDLPEINVDEFNSFLANEPLPLNNEDKTFYTYFFGNSDDVALKDTFSSMKTDEPIYVVFFADKRTDLWADFWEFPDKTEWAVVGGGCLVGGKIGATIGSIIPGAGTVAGGFIGCGAGLVLGSTVEDVVRKTEFVSSLYVGNDEGVLEGCRQ